jgi:hypothetical protein
MTHQDEQNISFQLGEIKGLLSAIQTELASSRAKFDSIETRVRAVENGLSRYAAIVALVSVVVSIFGQQLLTKFFN